MERNRAAGSLLSVRNLAIQDMDFAMHAGETLFQILRIDLLARRRFVRWDVTNHESIVLRSVYKNFVAFGTLSEGPRDQLDLDGLKELDGFIRAQVWELRDLHGLHSVIHDGRFLDQALPI
mmetsp:Transcript_4238/g.12097  ORF Transcript_4238/g.12097 Transcript_4238/m.12097 type:complete len:121 (+) Transcript_4238:437-799(+)